MGVIYRLRAGNPATRRNSSIELLRIIAMFMILAHHFAVHNGFDVTALPVGIDRFFLEVVFEGSGKVGVVIFFAISAWYLLDREQGLKSSLKRVWLMEGQLLFYGVSLFAVLRIMQLGALEGKDLLRSALPLINGCWWYMSAYAGFLILLPFLRKGLLALGREAHRNLSLIVLLVWGVLPMIPGTGIGNDSVFGFCCMATVMAYFKWFMEGERGDTFNPWKLVFLGYGIIFAGWMVELAIQMLLGKSIGLWLAKTTGLAAMAAGFGLFLVFERLEYRSSLANRLRLARPRCIS